MKARYAHRIRFAIGLARGEFLWGLSTLDAHRAAELWFPYANPLCRLEHTAFVRTYQALQRKAS